MRRTAITVLTLGLAALFGHRWLALAWDAWHYPVAAPTERTQAVGAGERAYVAAGMEGLEVVDLAVQAAQGPPKLVPPQGPADRIDDLALADGLLFALDATPPGHLATYSLDRRGLPAFTGESVPVPVGPFSGVAAAGGVVVVSGGTSQLTLREVDATGHLGTEVVTADFGRGQPDVSLRPDGRMAAISTHLYGPEFAITFAAIERQPLRLRSLSQLRLKDAGFTAGGFKPAHFPLVTAWRGDRLYVAEGGGLDVVDLADPARPKLVARDRLARPAMDALVAGNELYVLRAGAQPALLRYRFDPSGLPLRNGLWPLPSGSRPAGLAHPSLGLLLTLRERGWLSVPLNAFAPPSSVRP